ncbi:transporter substrate-binding domain-containing protein [Sulfurimonas sp. MAG313]|nr:transporter substrate-binding domain-containing protein [Sulfurimonas sp. MAG313]MDF1879988.1 transporter substrate-binding domain-containing protein [Sulfurimonas sp. MAG313]
MKFLLIILLILVQANAKELRFTLGKDSVIQKVSLEISTKAYARIGRHPHFITTSFSNALKLSNLGKVDGEVSRIKKISKKYPNLVAVPVAINAIEAVAFSKINDLKINNWKDLSPYKIAIVKGVKFIEHNTKNSNRVLVSSYKEAFDLINNEEVDIIVVPKLVGLYNIFKNKEQKIKVVSPSLAKLDLYHFVHKKNAYLIPQLTPILKQMENSGELRYMRDAYLRKITH